MCFLLFLDGGDSPVSLQEVKLNVLDRELCGQWYTIPVTDNMLCAGISPGGGYGPCHVSFTRFSLV